MTGVASVRAAVAAAIAAVPGVGLVSDRERYAKDAKRLAELYALPGAGGDKAEIRGWFVRRTATRDLSPARHRRHVWHAWQVRHFASFDDAAASEHAFDARIEAVREAFAADETLGGLAAGTVADLLSDQAAGLQLLDSGPFLLGNHVLVHAAELRLVTHHVE